MASVSASIKKGTLAPNYRMIFDQHALEVQQRAADANGSHFEAETLGAIQWTPEQKAEVFRRLERKYSLTLTRGRGTTSPVRVQALLRHLRNRGTTSPETGEVAPGDAPATVELSRDCELNLDTAAAELRLWQEHEAELHEKQRFGDYWLLNWDTSSSIESQEQSPNAEVPKALRDLRRAYELLDIHELLKLSHLLFMSSEDREEDWASYSADGPAIFASAILALFRLVHGVTRRLVMSSWFIAQSRIRATRTYSRRKEYVKPQDVQTALDVLGITGNREEYWIDLPRRCKLQVAEDRTAAKETSPMDDDEVETSLRQTGNTPTQTSTASGAAIDDSQIAIETHESRLASTPFLMAQAEPAQTAWSQYKEDLGSQSDTSELERKDQQASILCMRETYHMLGLKLPKSLREEGELPQAKRVKRSP